MSEYEWSDWSNDESPTENSMKNESQSKESAQTQTADKSEIPKTPVLTNENLSQKQEGISSENLDKISEENLFSEENIQIYDKLSVKMNESDTTENNVGANKVFQKQGEQPPSNVSAEMQGSDEIVQHLTHIKEDFSFENLDNISEDTLFPNENMQICDELSAIDKNKESNSSETIVGHMEGQPVNNVLGEEAQDASQIQAEVSSENVNNISKETICGEPSVKNNESDTIAVNVGAKEVIENGEQPLNNVSVEMSESSEMTKDLPQKQGELSFGNLDKISEGTMFSNENMQINDELSFKNNEYDLLSTSVATREASGNQVEISETNLSPEISVSNEIINELTQKQESLFANSGDSVVNVYESDKAEILDKPAVKKNLSELLGSGTSDKIIETQGTPLKHDVISKMSVQDCENSDPSRQCEALLNHNDLNEIAKPSQDEMPREKIIDHSPISANCLESTSISSTPLSESCQTVPSIPVSEAGKSRKQSSKSIIATSNSRRQISKKREQITNATGSEKSTGCLNIQKDNKKLASKAKRQPKRKRGKTSKQYQLRKKPDDAGHITSSSDDDIPLASIKLRKVSISEQYDDSDKDETFKPSAKDNNSTDTEYSSNLSDSERHDRNINRKLFDDHAKASNPPKKKCIRKHDKDNKLNKSKTEKVQQKTPAEGESSTKDDEYKDSLQHQPEQKAASSSQDKLFSLLESVKTKSRKEAEKQNAIQHTHEERLDQLLFSNGMKRIRVKSYGDCFFEAAAYTLKNISALALRQDICKHLDENMEEYIGFLLQHGSPEDELEFVSQYCAEIEKLKVDGYWSTKAGDFLPLALSNWSKRRVIIYTSKENQPTIEIHPTIATATDTDAIPLAYTAVPGINEHYDACRKMTPCDPMSSDQGVIDYIPCRQTVVPDAATAPTVETEEISVAESALSPANTSNTNRGTNQTTDTEGDLVGEEECYTAEPLYDTVDTATKPQNFSFNTPEKDQPEHSTSRQKLTPRKAAKFVSPAKKKLTRKRKATPQTWKKNIRKRLRITGHEYTSPHSGKKVPKRMLKPPCANCKFKCASVFSEDDRKKLFDSFWSLGVYERQKDFICSSVEEKKTRTYLQESNEPKEKKRMVSRSYSLETGGRKSTVCKKFFRATLDIGEAYINHALKQKSEGRFQGIDNRGRHSPANKTPQQQLKKVREHIESFPAIEAHYTRKDSNRKYLGPELNITKMYEEYSKERKQAGESKVTPSMYRKIFNEEYNYSFHVPKKDQCNLCTKYHRSVADGSITQELKDQYEKHQARKETAREEKERDKQLAKTHPNIFAATFDLQAVLYTPCSIVSLMYYMRKFCYYNFTVFSLATLSGTCYVWTEVEAKRGSCEIATCLNLNLQSLSPSIDHVIFYSDACGGQNRNQVIATCFLEAVETMPSINTIDHKFLESGHSQMECDSMHSAVDHAKKHTAIYTPYQWDTVLRQARRRNPYTVVPIRHGDVKDFKKVKQDRQKNVKLTTDGKKVQWNKIKWMRYTKKDLGTCYIKYDFDEEFQIVKVYGTKRGRSASAETGPVKGTGLPRKYTGKLPISAAKKKDLMQMCKSGVIPPEFHDFYEKLPFSTNAPDKLAEPDALEDDSGNDTEED